MADLKTSYMGIALRNPIMMGACNLVDKPDMICQLEEAGIGAFVYKSLFEEEIILESIQLEEELSEYADRSPEASNVFPHVKHAGPEEHLLNLKKFKQNTSVPVFASLNAISDEAWMDYARKIQDTGVDGIELNFYAVPGNFDLTAAAIEKKQIEIIEKVRKVISIPVAVKLCPYYTNVLNIIKRMDQIGVNGFVIFNRFFQPEINTGTEEFYYPFDLSKDHDYQITLRFTGLLYGNINASICGTKAIYNTQQMIKIILAGADAVQVVSTIYRNGENQIKMMLSELSDWMNKKGYQSINDFKGKLSKKKLPDSSVYNRAQHIEILSRSEEIYKKHRMV